MASPSAICPPSYLRERRLGRTVWNLERHFAGRRILPTTAQDFHQDAQAVRIRRQLELLGQ